MSESDVLAGILELPTRGEETNLFMTLQTGTLEATPRNYRRGAIDQRYKYCSIVLQGRGARGGNLEYLFPINPASVTVNRQTLDATTMTRGGWQTGIWGESMITIGLSGKTGTQVVLNPNDPFAYSMGQGADDTWGDQTRIEGLNSVNTDSGSEHSRSYRKLMELRKIFQNNGYFYEAEDSFGPLSSDGIRRRISHHGDVILTVGNFIWYGLFDSMDVSQSADSPFNADFDIQFTAWRETYRKSSGWGDSVASGVYRGHSLEAAARMRDREASKLKAQAPTTIETATKTVSPDFGMLSPSNLPKTLPNSYPNPFSSPPTGISFTTGIK